MSHTLSHSSDHDDHNLLHELRRRRRARRERRPLAPEDTNGLPSAAPRSLGEKLADLVADRVGSWGFVVSQSLVLALWIIGNAWFGRGAWDPYPFILLNLLLSFQAAYTAPIIMMSQNRMAGIDRRRAEQDYQVNVKAELEIELLHQKIDLLREQEILALTKAVTALTAQLETRSSGPA
ncbi:MAG: DUF1003 domain-containing protein [Ferrovibrio sp.]|nr:DUF1003 domain-containing protein [Ferrovibrio sp.]